MNEQEMFCNLSQHIKIQEGLLARVKIPFNREWIYTDKEIFRPTEVGFDDSAWQDVVLPHDYSIEHDFDLSNSSGASGGYVKTGILWYRKHFTIENIHNGKKIFINFDGISANSEVWVNGMLLSQQPSGYSPIHIDITNNVRFGEENLIAIKADTSLQPYSRFYQGTGIYRNVDLIITNPLHIDNFGVKYECTSITEGSAEIKISTRLCVAQYPETIWHDFGKEKNVAIEKKCSIVTTIFDANGYEVAIDEDTAVILEFSNHEFVRKIIISDPYLWSVDAPNMYYIHSKILVNRSVVDDIFTPMGIRSIKYSSKNGLTINDESVKLKGVCLHQDCGLFGANVPLKAWVKKLCLLKEMGANAVRTSHHPFMKEFYDICDIIGIYVMDETFDEWRKGWSRDYSENPYGKNKYGYYQYFDAWCEIDTKLMVKRDRNHPSIIMWSMGNEIPDFYYKEGVETLKKLVDFCKQEDTSRPVTIGAEGQYRLPIADGIMANLDIAGYNYVNLKHLDYYEKIHRENPDWVFVSSETFFEPKHWAFIKSHDYAIGQFIWSGYDYLGESNANNPINNMSIDFSGTVSVNDLNFGGMGASNANVELVHGWMSGMIDIIDNPKGQYYYHQSLWQNMPVIHIGVEMYQWMENGAWQLIPTLDIWDFKKGEVKNLYCYTNCDSFELFKNGKYIGKYEKDNGNVYPYIIPVTFEEGEIKVVGYVDSKIVAEHSLKSTKEAAKIMLECDYNEISADGEDIAHVKIRLTDEYDNLVYNNDKKVDIKVLGDAKIYRAGNGSLKNTQSYMNSCTTTFNGSAVAIVKAGKTKGRVTVVVECIGLEDASIDIVIK